MTAQRNKFGSPGVDAEAAATRQARSLRGTAKKAASFVATASVLAGSLVVGDLGLGAAYAADDPAPTVISATGAFAGVTVPDNVCSVEVVALGGGGGNPGFNGSPASQPLGGLGAQISATFNVSADTVLSGFVGGGGGALGHSNQVPNWRNAGGTDTGGAGGLGDLHHGGGGGGLTSVSLDGAEAIVAGGGGGGGGGHLLNGGFGGDGGLVATVGVVALGANGANGGDSSNRGSSPYNNDPTMIPGGGQGGQATAPGDGGVYTDTNNKLNSAYATSILGQPGVGRVGGAGGINPVPPGGGDKADTGGGGGGGYFGGGGGTDTWENGAGNAHTRGIGAGGGGGGASWVAASASSVVSTLGPENSVSAGPGNNGKVTFNWTACADPEIALTKTANTATFDAVGTEVEYTFDIENTGEVALTDVTLTDALPGLTDLTYVDWPGAPNDNPNEAGNTLTLAPGATAQATATYTTTQADVDRGFVLNDAKVEGTSPSDEVVSDTDAVTIDGPGHSPGLTLAKSADKATYAAGDLITYTFTLENTGNVTLTGVGVTDPLAGLSAITYTWPGTTGVLAPTQTATGTATYTATQADVDRGFVLNAATATGTPPIGPDPEVPSPPVTTPPAKVTIEGAEQAPEITLEKTGVLAVDENSVAYTFTATNTGNVTLSGVSITDPLDGLSALSYDWSTAAAEGVLAPNESVTATATYAVTQADRNAGAVVNLASTEGTGPEKLDPQNPEAPATPGETVTDTDGHLVSVTQAPAIQIVKTGSLVDNAGAASQPGDTVGYTFVVTNIGNVQLTDVAVSDPLAGLSAIDIDWSTAATEGQLDPAESVTGTATYALTQADIDNGSVPNTASVVGTPPNAFDPENPNGPGTPQDPVDDSDSEIVNPVVAPALALTKTGDFDGEQAAGETVTYTFVLENTGNQTLSGVTLTDEMLATAGVDLVFGEWPAAAGVLAPGQTVTATGVYTLTQADVNSGHLDNVATATGTPPTPPGGETPPALPPVEDDVTLPIAADPSIELVKSSALEGDAKAGDQVRFTFVSTNTGNVTLTDVTITDPMPGLSALVFDWSEAAVEGELAPGEQVTAEAFYTLTQADVDSGHVDNTATTVGTPPNAYDPADPEGPGMPREPVDDEGKRVTLLDPRAAIVLEKTGALDATSAAGETVTYTFIATNTGDATLSNVTISDPLAGLSELVFDWSDATADGVLAPGEKVTATAQYILTQADIDAGGVANLATTAGTPPNGYNPEDPEGPGTPREPVTDEDPAFVPTPQGPALQLVKQGALTGDDKAGEPVLYTLVATNTGNVTLTGVVISDALPGLGEISYTWPGAEGVLAPGEQVTATAPYELTQADVDAGKVVNEASVTGVPPTVPGEEPPAPLPPVTDDAIVPVTPAASIDLVKTSKLDGHARAGDSVTFSLTGTNTGNVTLSDVAISDPLPGLGEISYTWPGAEGVLAPGEQVTATAPYTLTQADVDAGQVNNTATIIGTPPATYDPEHPNTPKPQEPVSAVDTVKTPLAAQPAIDLVKTGKVTGKGLAGDKVEYNFVATNTGNVTLNGVEISDKLKGLSKLTYQWPGEAGALAPGEAVTATASYVLTAADVKAGSVVNDASVLGYTALGGDPVGGESVSDVDAVTLKTGKPSAPLAVTGGSAPLLGLASGLGLLLLGAGVVLAARSRKQQA
ncbi:DUF7507 domain-containing protein [Leucobacter sp. HY1910]